MREEMEAANVGAWQYFAVVPDMRATGVRDGVRAYEWPAIIRAINTVDVMTAEVPELDWALLKRMTDRITHEVPGICRVCYDLTPSPWARWSGNKTPRQLSIDLSGALRRGAPDLPPACSKVAKRRHDEREGRRAA